MNHDLNRKQSIVFFSDIVGYTLLMGRDEDQAFELMKQNLELHKKVLTAYHGLVIKELGDGILATFETAEEALNASFEIQKEWLKTNELKLRIGLHCGGIILDHGDVFGDAVNIASRVQSIGVPSCILFSSKVLEQIKPYSHFEYVSLGSFRLKNVAKELDIYALSNHPLAVPKRKEMISTIKFQEKEPWKFWVALSVAILLSILLIYSLVWNGYTWEKDKSVAVLPFETIGVIEGQDTYSKDVTEEIIDQLSEINDIKVISYSTVSYFTLGNINIDSIAKVLKVSTILRGSIQYLGEMTKVDVQLIDSEKNKNLWTESFTRNGKDLLTIQSEIAKEISRVLGISLTAKEEAEIGKVITSSPEAYEWYLKAKDHYAKYTLADMKIAAEYYKKAIEIDPNFTLAYAGLANSYAQFPSLSEDQSWYESSLEVSEIGLQIDPNNAELYKCRGNIYYNLGQINNAKRSYETALSSNPNYSPAIGNLATINFSMGNLSESLIGQKKSSSLNPINYKPYQIAGWIYRIFNQPKEALNWLNKSISLAEDPDTYSLIATVFISNDKIKDANELIPKTLTQEPNYKNFESAGFISFFSKKYPEAEQYYKKSILEHSDFEEDLYYVVPINYSFLLLNKGDKIIADSLLKKAIEIREKAISENNDDYNIRLDLAAAMAIKKQNQEALRYLRDAFDYGWRDLFFVTQNPIFYILKDDPTFEEIISLVQQEIEKENQLATSLNRSR
ncbi:class 3 adenylate cyclase [Algoriphagus ratkowskyi]|uniref:Class 3 adenylate cyclase n=1 Tax=Algoriphagus ratkowskyi TaxID=57028 RepID=A0A2W7QZ80_9BACT|nr:tetratricopeptide repeat protein [Algoriphagus ratkowskyi]PZX53818.1 class 3 adenylate cyclase [Algoriphagus ratkowskyi]TXD76777.1 tetratricopeptide repeat protein [Algoriphagus ratkowskyi]